ncbi:unnamed protein product, partial [Linum tenue]
EDVDFSLFDKVIKYALSHDTQHLEIDLHALNTHIDENYEFSELFGTISNCNLKTLKIRVVWIDDAFVACGFSLLTTFTFGRLFLIFFSARGLRSFLEVSLSE